MSIADITRDELLGMEKSDIIEVNVSPPLYAVSGPLVERLNYAFKKNANVNWLNSFTVIFI